MNKKPEIEKELLDLGIDIPKAEAFANLPNTYFKELPLLIKEKIAAEDFLNSLPKHTPYYAPANYFNEYVAKAPASFTINSRKKVWQSIAAAAAILAIAIGAFYFTITNKVSTTQDLMAGISEQEIQTYLIENADEEDLATIASNNPNTLTSINLNDISKEEIAEYIEPLPNEL